MNSINNSVLAFGVAFIFASGAIADEADNECHEISIDLDRLACYDSQTKYQTQTSEPSNEPIEPSGQQWLLTQEKSSLDGRTDVWLRLTSKNTQPNQIGRPEKAYLWARCMNNSTNFFITFNDYTSDNQNVRYRLDDGPVQKKWMVHMQGGDGIGIWSGGSAIPFIKNLFGKGELVLAYESYGNQRLEFSFDVSGLRQRIDPLAESCQWKP